jgi:hypothetical protein
MRAAILELIFCGGLAVLPARAACGPGGPTVRDWGLHRAWAVVENCAHPERPAQLQEIAWRADAGTAPGGRTKSGRADLSPVEVQPGMPVRVWRQTANMSIELQGTALQPGRRGERIAVRAGLGATVIEGRVVAPGLVELASGKRAR